MEITRKEFESIMAERGSVLSGIDSMKPLDCYFIETFFNWLLIPEKIMKHGDRSNVDEIWTNSAIDNIGKYDSANGFVWFDDNDHKIFEATENQISFINKVIEDDELTVID